MRGIDEVIKNRYLPVFLFLLALGIYLLNSWGVSIYILDEAKNATCAREMLDKGNWLVPTFNFDLRTDKPPLHYFFMMLSYSIFGVNPFAARFFSAIFGALTILVTYIYTRQFADSKTAFWTAVVLLSSIHLSLQFHLAVPDPYLIFFMTWSLFSFYSVVCKDSKLDWLWMYVSMGLATLAKGPVAILLPGLIFLLFLIFSKKFDWKTIKKLKPFIGVVLVVAIVLPWYVMNGLATDWEWTRGFFFEHNLDRFSGEMEGHGGIFLLTVLFVVVGLFPFAVFLPQALRFAFQNKKNMFMLFSLAAGLSIVGFFSVSQTKLPNYTVPAYPFLAVITGFFITHKLTNYRQVRVAFISLLSLSIFLPIAAFVAMKFDPSLLPVRHLSVWLFVFPAFLFLAWNSRNSIHKFLLITGFSGLITALVFFEAVYPVIDHQNPVSNSLRLVENKEVRYYEKFNPSYSFYLQRKIERIDADGFHDFFQQNPDGIIISTKRRINELGLDPQYEVIFSGKDIFESPTTVLIALKKN